MSAEGDDACVLCPPNNTNDLITLCENEHSICKECLKGNAKRYGLEKMYTCPKCKPDISPENKKVWVYVDGSNVWIEAKKLAKDVRGFDTAEDWRLRVSWKQLTDAVLSGRQLAEEPKLYVSKRPQEESMWENLEGFDVIEKDKSDSGKEKEVDGQIIADVTTLACKTPEVDRSTIILVTGDGDIKPAIKRAIKEGKWHVEIHTWEHACSQRLQELQEEEENVTCTYLDEHLRSVTYIERRIEWDKENHPKCSAVLEVKPGELPFKDTRWWTELEDICKWPVQGEWMNEDHFVLVFGSDTRKQQNYAVHRLVDTLNKDNSIRATYIKAETYFDYTNRLRQYNKLSTHESGAHSDPSPSISSPSEDFDDVVPAKKATGRPPLCWYGLSCPHKNNCKYYHSQDQKEYFKKHSRRS